jgi:hypothetical protein
MSFVGAMVVMCAVVGLGELARRSRTVAAGGLAVLTAMAALTFETARREVMTTYEYATRDVLELREWSRRLPPGASVRIDVPPSGQQLWADYMLADRPVSARKPLVGFFPYAPQGRRADYVLAMNIQPRPADALGAPLFANREYRLWRMRPGVPGPDTSSRRMVDSISSVDFG